MPPPVAPPPSRVDDDANANADADLVQTPNTRWQDNPLAQYLLENGSIVLIALATYKVGPRVGTEQTLSSQFARALASVTLQEWATNAAQFLFVTSVYPHIPYFATNGLPSTATSLRLTVKDWIASSFFTNLLAAAGMTVLRRNGARAPEAFQDVRWFSEGALAFLRKLAIARVLVDVVFWAVHRALHSDLLYARVHKLHHQHYQCRTSTNFHFTVLDQVLEGPFPIFVAVCAQVMGLGYPFSPFELALCLEFFYWHLSATHSGKTLPTHSYFPPLSIVYRHFWDVDKHGIVHHERHHNCPDTNFGITHWIDWVMGTLDLSAPGSSFGVGRRKNT